MTQYLNPAELYAPDEVDVVLLRTGDSTARTVRVHTQPHRVQPVMNEPWRTNLMLSQMVEPGIGKTRSQLKGPSASEAPS